MKKKIVGLLVASVAVFALSGCGGGGGDDYYDPGPIHITKYLQTYDWVEDLYYGVPDVYWECGPDYGITNINGAFTYVEGDDCTFFGLDETLSIDFLDELYLSSDPLGHIAVTGISYICDSGWRGSSDIDGMFTFDPFWDIAGDTCTFIL